MGVAAPTGGLFRVLQPAHVCSDSLQSWAQGGGWPGVTREGSPTGKVLPASGPSSLWLSPVSSFQANGNPESCGMDNQFQ